MSLFSLIIELSYNGLLNFLKIYWSIAFNGLFIFLYLAVLGLHCCMQAFSSCREKGLFSSCGVRASHCSGFCCGAQALGCVGFSSCGTQA